MKLRCHPEAQFACGKQAGPQDLTAHRKRVASREDELCVEILRFAQDYSFI
jgi:hypothetical protein